jgi:hypothetical protein
MSYQRGLSFSCAKIPFVIGKHYNAINWLFMQKEKVWNPVRQTKWLPYRMPLHLVKTLPLLYPIYQYAVILLKQEHMLWICHVSPSFCVSYKFYSRFFWNALAILFKVTLLFIHARYVHYICATRGLIVSKKWSQLAHQARDANGFVSSCYLIECVGWFLSQPNFYAQDLVRISQTMFHNYYETHLGDMASSLVECRNVVQSRLMQEWERRRREPPRSHDTNGLPPITALQVAPINPLRELVLQLCRTLWALYSSYFNDDVGQLVELAPSTYRRQNCRDVMVGFRIMCPLYESHALCMKLKKLAAMAYFNLMQGIFDNLIQNHVWENDQVYHRMTQLCCGGFICRTNQSTIRGCIQVVELEGPGVIAWIKLSSDDRFILSGPPRPMDPVVSILSLENT